MDRTVVANIKKWLYRNARPLDWARWQYHFGNGDRQTVLEVLSAYQNEDGGFGHALEADCWNPKSSPLQTWCAIQFLREIDFHERDHPLVSGIFRYLASGDGTRDGRWLFSVPSNNSYPRAPWWKYDPNNPSSGYNPTIALVGYILRYGDEQSQLYVQATGLLKSGIEAFVVSEKPVDMHELACYLELFEDLTACGKLNLIETEGFEAKLKQQISESIEKDTEKWYSDYGCKPSHYIKTPKSICYNDNQVLMDKELDMLSEYLNEEGIWPVTWQWGAYPENFAISARWWQGYFAVENLMILKAFGRLG